VLGQRSCSRVPPKPADLDSTLIPAETTRESFEQTIEVSPVCVACHALMDHTGFGFLHFDEEGRYRDEENGHRIDATAELYPDRFPFDGAIELNDYLAEDDETARCVAQQLFTLAGLQQVSDAMCHLANVTSPLGASSTFRDALRAVVTSEALSAAL
jgi:hypothetical protein